MKQQQTRVDKIDLALNFTAPQTGNQAFALHQTHTQQPDALPIKKTKPASGKVGLIENRIKSPGVPICRIRIARGPQKGDFGT